MAMWSTQVFSALAIQVTVYASCSILCP